MEILRELDTTKRFFVAVALIIVFFVFYDRFISPRPKYVKNLDNNETEQVGLGITLPKITQDKKNIIANIQTKDANFSIDNLGRIAVALYQEKGRAGYISLFNSKFTLPLEVRFANLQVNKEAFEVNYVADRPFVDAKDKEQSIVLIQKLKDLTLTKKITFYPKGNYLLEVSTDKPEKFFITPGFRPDHEVDSISVHGSLVLENDDTLESIEDGDADGDEVFPASKMVSSFDRYYTTLFYNFKDPFSVHYDKILNDDPLAFVKSDNSKVLVGGYIGPKNVNLLRSINPQLVRAVEYGVLTFLSAPLFSFLDLIHSYVGNWGWSIIVFIFLVKVILYPLSYKGMVSMAKLKELAPKIKELQAKYKGDSQKLQIHMMELYKKHGANPMGGCFPILVQIPIFFAIYRVLVNSIELRGSHWLYIQDLSAMDPYFILPILMGASMFLQQRMTPSNFADPTQERIMKYLPVIFTIFFIKFPSGLVLYWFANNILSIIQQFFVNKTIAKHKALKND